MKRSEIQSDAGNIDGLKWRVRNRAPVFALDACRACGNAFELRLACGLSEVGDVEAYGVAFIEAALGEPSRYSDRRAKMGECPRCEHPECFSINCDEDGNL